MKPQTAYKFKHVAFIPICLKYNKLFLKLVFAFLNDFDPPSLANTVDEVRDRLEESWLLVLIVLMSTDRFSCQEWQPFLLVPHPCETPNCLQI